MLEFLQKQKTDIESFLAVLIEEQWITSSVWQIVDNKVNVVSTSNPTRWEEEMVNAVDTSISSAMQNLDENFKDPEKTVFGLPSSWIEGGNIKEEYLLKLKKVCDDLSLVPTGFVVLSEAIANYYKGEEGSGITGVVIGVSDQNLEISIFNLGNLVGVTNVARSISFEDDLTEGLVRLSANAESLPSRIVLFNQKEQELEDIKEILPDAEIKYYQNGNIDVMSSLKPVFEKDNVAPQRKAHPPRSSRCPHRQLNRRPGLSRNVTGTATRAQVTFRQPQIKAGSLSSKPPR
jgi:hypothetical protein